MAMKVEIFRQIYVVTIGKNQENLPLLNFQGDTMLA